MHWDLAEGETYVSHVLTHPSVNVTFLPVVGAEIHGVVTATYRRPLAGRGRVLGVKFRPGGFYAYANRPVTSFTDRSVALNTVMGPVADELANDVLDLSDDDQRIAVVEEFLRSRLPSDEDPAYTSLLEMVAMMLSDRTVTRVDHVAQRFGVSVRTLQRMFHRYVGVGPKWMIRRYRMHDVAELLATGTVRDQAALAVELGWFDQAHLARDFSALIGVSPSDYAASCAASKDREPTMLVAR